ncbi:MAG: FKBP-type peptidyl-prolyl cis-trans isomerase, partial [Acidimicrobiales bacterium]
MTVRWVEADVKDPRRVIATTWTSVPQSFEVGTGQVIKGLDLGVRGMRRGGRRELIVPPALAFRPISNITVVLVVDLVRIGGMAQLPESPPGLPVAQAAMHGTLVLRSFTAANNPPGLVTGPTPPVTTGAALRLSLDRLVDPA